MRSGSLESRGNSFALVVNNFSSFAARVASDTYVGNDGCLHFQTKFGLYEMEDHGYVVGIAVWLLRAAERTAELPAMARRRR